MCGFYAPAGAGASVVLILNFCCDLDIVSGLGPSGRIVAKFIFNTYGRKDMHYHTGIIQVRSESALSARAARPDYVILHGKGFVRAINKVFYYPVGF